ncbi:phage tail tape measure protein [Lactococcus garvieae]|uniref:Phage tail length tape-measure protein n=1 Tax=Lactococcus garvieae DCC43 TaxID=1231377 RepID=K2NVY1_9LACT|nr:phage tail tape measure protein [Lactococcus garvieae]EKF51713.1 Phage tail length tape-measure protein [Lactococcus garvieae DCC43]
MSDTPLGRMIVELGITDTKFTQGVGGVKAELKSLQNDFKASQTAFKNFGGQIDGVGHPMTKLNTLIDKQKQYVSQLANQYKGSLNKETGEATRATDGYARQLSAAKSQLVQYYAQQKQLANQIKIGAQEQYKQNSIMPKIANGFDTASKKIDAFGNKMMPASVALTGVFYKGVQSAAEFNGKMTEIQALLADDTSPKQLGKNMDILASKSKEWARQYGVDTSSINEGMEEMIKKGYNFNQTLGAMPSVLDASKASGEDFNTVMSSSTSILEQFGLVSKDTATMNKNTQRVTDSLAFVANKTAAGFSDMGNAMEYAGPVSHALGISLEETSAAIGLMSNNGIEGEKAGTALRGALSRLMKPSDTAADAMAKLGINLDAFRKGQLGLPDILDNIKESTQGMTKAQKASLLSIAFGTEAQTGMNILVSQGGDALRNLTKETQNATGYTKKLADQMNNSDKNEFAKAKATIETLSIDLGEKLLPSIVPIVKEASNLADGFSKLDPKTQQLLINMGLIAAASYPASKALSGVTSIVGILPKQMAKWGAVGAGKLALKGLETGAVGASSSLGGLAPVIAGMGPVAIAATAALGAAGLGFAIFELTKGIREQEKEVSKWGTVVGSETSGKLDTLNTKFTNVTSAARNFDIQGTPAIGNVKQAIADLGKAASDSITDTEKALEKGAKAAGLTDKQVKEAKTGLEQQKTNVKTITDQITSIYQNASNAKRGITNEERAIVESNQQKLLETTIRNYGISGDKAKDVMKVFSGDISSMNLDALSQASSNVKKMMDGEVKTYKSGLAALNAAKEAGKLSDSDYNKKREALEAQHNDVMKQYGEDYYNAQNTLFQKTKGLHDTNGYEAIKFTEKMKKTFKSYGLDYQKVMDNVGKSGKKGAKEFGDTSHLIAQYTSNMSKDAKKADDSWNAIVLDPKTGKIKTNAQQVIQDSIKTPQGWAQMKFIAKNANLTTNARETMAKALVANGQWESLKPSEKKLILGNDKVLNAVYSSKESIQAWNNLPAKSKELWAKDQTKAGKDAAQNTMNTLHDVERLLKSKNLTKEQKDQAQKTMDSLKSVQRTLNSKNATLPQKIAAQNTLNSLQGVTRNLTAANKTQSGKNSAQATIDSTRGKSASITASNNASSGVSSAQATLDQIPDRKTTVWDFIANIPNSIRKILHLQSGTPYHQGGLAVVNDQKGPTYKELIKLPNGTSFIPQGRDVMLPLPKGSQVLKARETAKLIPKYANGTGGIPQNAKIFREMNAVQGKLGGVSKTSENSELVKVMKEVLTALKSNNYTQNYDPKIEVTLNVEESSLSKRKVYEDLSQHLGKAMQREMKRKFER